MTSTPYIYKKETAFIQNFNIQIMYGESRINAVFNYFLRATGKYAINMIKHVTRINIGSERIVPL